MPVISKKLNHYNLLLLLVIVVAFTACNSSKQSQAKQSPEQIEYLNSINKRSAKIVAGLGITDSAKFHKVSDVIAAQYINLKNIDEKADEQKIAVKEKFSGNKIEAEAQIKNIDRATEVKKTTLHGDFLKRLGKYLNAAQIEKVKDGLTYGVLPITYKGYLDMIPTLKAEEKQYIYDALVEAREKAMDGGSSDEKHGVFGKYKGRINNYLSARGYNLTKEREEWNKRIEATKKNNSTNK